MTGSETQVDLSGERLELGEAANTVSRIAGGIGVLGLLASGILGFGGQGEEAHTRFYLAYFVSFVFFLSITLGALFFVILQHLTRAGWSVVVRRFAEAFSVNFWLLLLLFLPLLFGLEHLYEWMRPGVLEHDALLQKKSPYLNRTFFLIRIGIYFLTWILLSRWFFARSLEQDRTGAPELTTLMQKVSAPGMFAFAFTLTFAAFDLLMSLEPHWYSTIFGVYFFSGSALSFFAVLPITSFAIQRSGRLQGVISPEHYHDMGKLIFAFIVFWTYIAFSQYMLIWYGDIPEETTWYLRRQTGEWATLSWFLLIGHFVVPFLALISRIPKRQKGALALGAVWVLFVHYVDLYYLVMPHASEGKVPLHILDLTCFLGIGGFYVAAFANRLRNRSLIPIKDPRLAESLAFENY